MTRFARAKGSKASNEKAPENSTPWEVMKEQLVQAKKDSEDAKKRLEAEQQRVENYQKFLKDQRVQKRKASWCEFPEANVIPKKIKECDIRQDKKNKNNKNKSNPDNRSNDTQVVKICNKKPSGIQQGKTDVNSTSTTSPPQSHDLQNSKKKNKKKTFNKLNPDNGTNDTQVVKICNKKPSGIQQGKTDVNSTSTTSPPQSHDLQNSKKKKKKNKNKTFNDANTSQTDDLSKQNSESKNFQQDHNTTSKNVKKSKKNLDGKPQRRKVVNDSSFQLIINGKDVELVRFEGFPIMKKDAERLQELKNNMIKKGIPKSEVQRTIKLERRRAEKALARLKKDVCYNCRKGGHNLSDCPELKSKIPGVGAADGVCFKCGSTEHRQFECKVQKDKEFRFASCFICREQGHIARQCPDNPKGLYPNGGACKLCGDVTHLRKDCPTDQEKRVESTVKLSTIAGADNIEDIY